MHSRTTNKRRYVISVQFQGTFSTSKYREEPGSVGFGSSLIRVSNGRTIKKSNQFLDFKIY